MSDESTFRSLNGLWLWCVNLVYCEHNTTHTNAIRYNLFRFHNVRALGVQL